MHKWFDALQEAEKHGLLNIVIKPMALVIQARPDERPGEGEKK